MLQWKRQEQAREELQNLVDANKTELELVLIERGANGKKDGFGC